MKKKKTALSPYRIVLSIPLYPYDEHAYLVNFYCLESYFEKR